MLLDAASRAGAGMWKIQAKVRGHLLAALLAVCASVLMTWPLASNPGQQLLRAAYFWDAYTNAMLMGSRVDAAFGRSALSLYDSYYFAPLPHSIVFNENHFGLSILFAPFYLVSQSPLWAYNLTLLSSLSLSVFFTYLLVLRLTRSPFAGLIAGVAFAFCPYVLFEIGRIQLVATQWIPACFLFLHRALERQRPREIIGFWLCILLQIGTCLYYAMFMLPLLALLGGALLLRQRPRLRFFGWFAGCAIAAGLVAFLMVHPYFSARHEFNLQRSPAFASSYDGKLEFFANVAETNLTLTGMHHQDTEPGAHEEIAFPGFSAGVLALVGLTVAAFRGLRRLGGKQALVTLLLWSALGALAVCFTWLESSMLAGALVLALGAVAWLMAARLLPQPLAANVGLYFAVLLLAVALFLGLNPELWDRTSIHGLYYYLYTYVPGFDGIRKVSRQAVMTTFVVCILAGFGASRLFAKLRRSWARVLTSALLLGGLCYELRCFPHPVERVWGADQIPAVLRFAAKLPTHDLLAFAPQSGGKGPFFGDAGMAFHNYLSLYHRHRFVNGQSSWQPPVTELARLALEALPAEGARRALLAIGTRHVILFGEALEPGREDLAEQLAARPTEYRRVFQQGSHSLFSLLGAQDPTLEPLPTPALPSFARLVPKSELRATSSLRPDLVVYALDGKSESLWTTATFQEQGQFFELQLAAPRPIVALEIDVPGRVMDVPVSYRVSAANGAQDLGVVAEQSVLRFYREQIFSPETFVFRLVFPRPIFADRLRFTVGQALPGYWFSIHELRLYSAP
ncbi:MAG TPA: hypothetical protein VER12_09415 [Polyangiaceae bacterium]|nr:hypothetical protein [Polyangiaceae bacterium]